MSFCQLSAAFVVSCLVLTVSSQPFREEPSTVVEEQIDPFLASRMQLAGYPSANNGLGYPQIPSNANAMLFDFQCKCTAKQPSTSTAAPADAAAASQQQIQQLNEQIRRLQEQIRRQQQGASAFEQFAQMLSMADGLDCNCSGSNSQNSVNAQTQQQTQQSLFPSAQNMNMGQMTNPYAALAQAQAQARYGGLTGLAMQQRMAPAYIPQIQGPLFPMKS